MQAFGRSDHRYLHVSCHGNATGFFTTTGKIASLDFARILAPHVDKRRVFLSACLAAESKFARELLTLSDCWSVLAPVGSICFDDAAIFWTAFYHLMFKQNPDAMKRAEIEVAVHKCAKLVERSFASSIATTAKSSRKPLDDRPFPRPRFYFNAGTGSPVRAAMQDGSEAG